MGVGGGGGGGVGVRPGGRGGRRGRSLKGGVDEHGFCHRWSGAEMGLWG